MNAIRHYLRLYLSAIRETSGKSFLHQAARSAHFIPAALACLGLHACSGHDDKVLLISEINMLGNRHDLTYKRDTLSRITYSTFITSSEADSAKIDTVIRRDIDSLIYEPDNSISLLRTFSRHGRFGKVHRKYHFNSDNLLSTISRFNGNTEYTTDSIVYDYTTRKVDYYDLVNGVVEELEYDRDDNIVSIVERKISGNHSAVASALTQEKASAEVVQTTYNYFTTTRDPFLINLDDEELLFGCFHRSSISIYWNGAHRPEFKSAYNVQATKQTRHGQESNALYEYQFRDGLPTARYGGYGAVFYRYRKLK